MTPPHYNEAFDEYARALLAQNNGMPCTHCGSSLGHYTIDRIEANGTLHAGCHVISLAEIENLAPALDAVTVTASESEASNV